MKLIKSSNPCIACLLVTVACWFLASAMPVGAADSITKVALQGDWPQVYEEGMKSSPKTGGLERDLLLGYACMYRKDWVKAWQYFSTVDKSSQKTSLLSWAENLCRENPKSAMALVFKGDALIRLGRYQEAVAALDQAVQLEPRLTLAYELRGLARFNGGATSQAKGDLEVAMRIDSRLVNALYQRALLDFSAKDYPKAETQLTGLLAMEPRFFLARNARGIAYLMQAKYDSAIKDFEDALQENRDFIAAQKNKNYALRLRSDRLLAEDLKKLAQHGAKGPLGSMSIAVGGDAKSLEAAIKGQTELAYRQFGKDNVVSTSDLGIARQALESGKFAVLGVDTAKPGNQMESILNYCQKQNIQVTSILPNGNQSGFETLQAVKGLQNQGYNISSPIFIADPSEAMRGGKVGLYDTKLDDMAKLAGDVIKGGANVTVITTEDKWLPAHIGNINSFMEQGVTVISRKWEGAITTTLGGLIFSGIDKASDAAGRTAIDQSNLWTIRQPGGKTFESGSLIDVLYQEQKNGTVQFGGKELSLTSLNPVRQGVYLKLGKPGMDVTTASRQDVDFLQKNKNKAASRPETQKSTGEMLLSHPFLIANP